MNTLVTISTQVIMYKQYCPRQISQSDCSIYIKLNYLIMKQCLNSDGQQFHQNEQPSLTSNQTTTSHLKPNNHLSPQTKQPPLTSNQTTISHLKPNNHFSPQTKQPALTSNQQTRKGPQQIELQIGYPGPGTNLWCFSTILFIKGT
jgi:hypothetical protein